MKSLIIIPNLEATTNNGGQIFLTKKFIDGVIEYGKYWDGCIKILIRASNMSSSNLDDYLIDRSKLPFEIIIIDYNVCIKDIENSSIVLVGMSYKNNNVSELCQSINIPSVYITENTMKTEIQVVKVSKVNLIIKVRRIIWLLQNSFKQNKALKKASGIQCNGTPTYNKYKKINKNAFLYFDNRVNDRQLISEKTLKNRLKQFQNGKPITLAFSGRLIDIKGVDHLIKVANELKLRGFLFTLRIYGSGLLEAEMKRQILQYGLGDIVFMCGVLDFELELLPTIQRDFDLFICCHKQGDPSCTYIETLACGVPIVGYSNEAFDGILQLVNVGYSVKMNDFIKLSDVIMELSGNKKKLSELSYNAMNFSKENLFDRNFEKRMSHLKGLCNQ